MSGDNRFITGGSFTLGDILMDLHVPRDRLASCIPDPIHVPGAVQPHGAFLAVDQATWKVTHASANLDAFLGVGAAEALDQPLVALFGEAATALLRSAIATRRSSPCQAGIDAGLATGRVRLMPFVNASGSICIDLLHDMHAESAEPALLQAQRVVQSLRLSRTSVGLCRIAVNEIRRITGFERVMVYCFDADGSGDVVAENHAVGIDSLLGLKYPANDIPPEARRLYMLQRMRIIPDVNAVPVPLRAVAGHTATDIDLSASSIRAVSPCHLQYVRHMGVAATAVISLIVEGRLWGMLVCHHGVPMNLGGDQRALLDLIGQVMSFMLGSINDGELGTIRMERQRALGGIAAAIANPEDTVSDAFASIAGELIALVPADGAAISINARTIFTGRTPPPEPLRAIMTSLAEEGSDDLAASIALQERSNIPPGTALAGFAGAMRLPLPNCGNGSITWFRRELSLTVNWAGNPTEADVDPTTGLPAPRRSFALWREEVRGRSTPWTSADMEAARDLRRIVDEALVRRSEGEVLLRLRDNDPLTGLPNRRALEAHLKAIATLTAKPRVALVVANVDRFRNVNELLGHDAGDALLVQIAHRLQLTAGQRDMVARLETDEFGLVSSSANAADFAARVASAFTQPFDIAKHVLQVNASIGVAEHTGESGLLPSLLRSAETAMRQAKAAGGNRISIFEQTLRDTASRQLLIEQSLDGALRSDRDQFYLAFQPIVDLTTGALRSWEVLLRWRHPTLGDVRPDQFIPIAERCGMIGAVGDIVLDKAMRYLVETPASAEANEQDVYLSVNVSPLQLTRAGFVSDLAAMLHARGITPAQLCIEVTEGVFANHDAVAAISAIRRLGIAVAVDDFGVGYSSLSSLQRLPADVVKLDRSFLPEQGRPSDAEQSFLAAVVMLAHTAGLKVVIEGVETQIQLEAVVAAGGDAVQGYHLARPMSGEAAMALTCQNQAERAWMPHLQAAK